MWMLLWTLVSHRVEILNRKSCSYQKICDIFYTVCYWVQKRYYICTRNHIKHSWCTLFWLVYILKQKSAGNFILSLHIFTYHMAFISFDFYQSALGKSLSKCNIHITCYFHLRVIGYFTIVQYSATAEVRQALHLAIYHCYIIVCYSNTILWELWRNLVTLATIAFPFKRLWQEFCWPLSDTFFLFACIT